MQFDFNFDPERDNITLAEIKKRLAEIARGYKDARGAHALDLLVVIDQETADYINAFAAARSLADVGNETLSNLGAMGAYRAAEVVSERYNVASGTEDLTPGAAYAILRLVVTPESYRY